MPDGDAPPPPPPPPPHHRRRHHRSVAHLSVLRCDPLESSSFHVLPPSSRVEGGCGCGVWMMMLAAAHQWVWGCGGGGAGGGAVLRCAALGWAGPSLS
eukprot:scaffold7215_cov366-Prasinococcus_capsulatus_cf.AAC.26